MAVTWEKIFRQVALLGNQLNSGNPATLQSAYTAAAIGQTEMADKAVHFPKEAIDDFILDACDVLIGAIGRNRHSDYRIHFRAATANLTNGALLPKFAADGVTPRIGSIGEVTDSATGERMTAASFQKVNSIVKNSFIKSPVYLFFSDDTRLWHTVTNAIADIVAYNKETQRTALAATPARGICPFPEELHEAIVCGALSYMFRQNTNIAQVNSWRSYFEACVGRVEGEPRIKAITQE